jgi:hypothetical protein
MGMSCTQEQSETMEMLFKKEHEQPGWGTPGTYALDGHVAPRDYGYPPHTNLNISIMLMAENSTAFDAGKIRIAPDGTFTMPTKVRKALGV